MLLDNENSNYGRPISANPTRRDNGHHDNPTSRLITKPVRPSSAYTSAGTQHRSEKRVVHSGKRVLDDDEQSISSKASRKIALEHIHNNFG